VDGGRDTADGRVPVVVATGYLGAGKTTLVNRILAQADGRRYAVVVNEFGDIGIDGLLIDSGGEELIQLASGCVCCVVRGDLIRSLRALLRDSPPLDGIVIETTGLANPGPVIQTFFADQILQAQCRLDSVITLVDAVHMSDQLADSPDAADQIALGDLIVLNKVSDAAADADELEATLRRLNPFAPILRADRCAVDVSNLFHSEGFELERIEGRLAALSAAEEDHDHRDPAGHIAGAGIGSLALACDVPLDAQRLEDWLRALLSVQGRDILRTKGVISVAGEQRKLVVQAVNMMLEGDFTGPWGEHEPRRSLLVFIGRNLDHAALRAGFLAAAAAPVH
jgi:G3E family GTPase